MRADTFTLRINQVILCTDGKTKYKTLLLHLSIFFLVSVLYFTIYFSDNFLFSHLKFSTQISVLFTLTFSRQARFYFCLYLVAWSFSCPPFPLLSICVLKKCDFFFKSHKNILKLLFKCFFFQPFLEKKWKKVSKVWQKMWQGFKKNNGQIIFLEIIKN